MSTANEAQQDTKSEIAIEELSFEKAMAELEAIVTRLERGDVPLEQSIEIYGRGEALKKHCETLLKAAESKVEKIRLDSEGKPQATDDLDK